MRVIAKKSTQARPVVRFVGWNRAIVRVLECSVFLLVVVVVVVVFQGILVVSVFRTDTLPPSS